MDWALCTDHRMQNLRQLVLQSLVEESWSWLPSVMLVWLGLLSRVPGTLVWPGHLSPQQSLYYTWYRSYRMQSVGEETKGEHILSFFELCKQQKIRFQVKGARYLNKPLQNVPLCTNTEITCMDRESTWLDTEYHAHLISCSFLFRITALCHLHWMTIYSLPYPLQLFANLIVRFLNQ